jgi:hypothetical protein
MLPSRVSYNPPFSIVILFCAIIITALFPQTVSGSGPQDHEDYVQTYPRDVYVIVGSTLRNPDETTSPAEPLFNDAGVALDMTWGAWQNGKATATAHVQGGPNSPRTDIRIHLTGLVPGGVYSLFYGTLNPDSENPLCPGVERTLPLVAFKAERQSPDASSFIADANGEADYRSQVEGDLLSALQVFYTVIYHADHQTYHPLPNAGEFQTQGSNCRSSFGHDAMRQFFIFQKS